ncbi:MAG: ABC transporter permease [Proteobacteria bacterium]|nr:ABC transporter permease [Pseudomonadota bacterium]
MGKTSLASMAWRNLWRNRRRTAVTLSSIAFGILLAVLFTGMGDGTYSRMINLAARMGGGHVTLQHPEYLDLPSLKRTVTGVRSKQEIALNNNNVTRAVERITGQTMLATAANSLGAYFIAIDPQKEDETTLSVIEAIVQGEMFKSTRDKGIILGERLADNLDLKMGRKVVYTMTDKNGEIVSGLARVAGIVRTGSPSIDQGLCLLPIDTMREILGYADDEAVQVALFLKDQRKSYEAASQLGPKVGNKVATLTWRETQPDLAGFISMKIGGAIFMEILIMILIAAGIFNTLFVSVMERMREFGIMMAIGFSPSKLFRLVMWESLWLALVGLVASAVVTAWPYYQLSKHGLDMSEMMQDGVEVAGVGMDPIMYVSIYPENVVIIAAVVVLATILSGLYPAWKAGRVVPVESIKVV